MSITISRRLSKKAVTILIMIKHGHWYIQKGILKTL